MDIQNCDEMIKACEAGMAVIRELDEYRKIGTVDECRTAREKMKPKKPVYVKNGHILGIEKDVDIFGGFINWWRCQVCHKDIHSREGKFPLYCENCGQALDWTDVD